MKADAKRLARNARERAQYAELSPEQRLVRKGLRTPEEREAKLERRRQDYAEMTPEQREAVLERRRQRYAEMTPEQREAELERRRQRYGDGEEWYNITPARQVELQAAVDKAIAYIEARAALGGKIWIYVAMSRTCYQDTINNTSQAGKPARRPTLS